MANNRTQEIARAKGAMDAFAGIPNRAEKLYKSKAARRQYNDGYSKALKSITKPAAQ